MSPDPTPTPPAAPGDGAPVGVFQTLDVAQVAPYGRAQYVPKILWAVVQATLWKWPRAWGWRRWLLRRFGAQVGNRAVFLASSRVMHPWLLEIGDFSTVGPGAVIYNLGPVKIGSHTTISQGCYVCAGTHDYTVSNLPLVRPPVTIGSGVWVAAQAFIGPGVTVGDNAVVGARAVVVKDVPPGMVAAGNPARVIKPRDMRTTVTARDPGAPAATEAKHDT